MPWGMLMRAIKEYDSNFNNLEKELQAIKNTKGYRILEKIRKYKNI